MLAATRMRTVYAEKAARRGDLALRGAKRDEEQQQGLEERDTYIVLVIILIVGQFHNTIGALKRKANCTVSSSFTLSPHCSRLADHGLTKGTKKPLEGPSPHPPRAQSAGDVAPQRGHRSVGAIQRLRINNAWRS